MDPLTIPLALGCILTFSHVNRAMTEEDGSTPDDIEYKMRVLKNAARGKGFSPGDLFYAGREDDLGLPIDEARLATRASRTRNRRRKNPTTTR